MKQRATIICWRQGRILLVERGTGRWSLPGGTIRRCESALQAATRELNEETSLYITGLEFQFIFAGFNKQHQVFFTELPGGAVPVASNEIQQCRWFRLQRTATLPVSVPTREIIRLVFPDMRASAQSARPVISHGGLSMY